MIATTYATDVHKSLPASEDAERAVISCCLQAPTDCIDDVHDAGGAQLFYIPALRIIWEAIWAIKASNQPVDLIALNTYIRNHELLDQVGGAGALADLLDDVPTSALLKFYLDTLREKMVRRLIIQSETSTIASAYDETTDIREVCLVASKDLERVADLGLAVNHLRTMHEMVLSRLEVYERAFEEQTPLHGIQTGFPEFDRHTRGLVRGRYHVVVARPSWGKTAWLTQVAANIAGDKETGAPGAVFSAEMIEAEIIDRMVAQLSGVSLNKLGTNELSQAVDFPNIIRAAKDLAKKRLFVDDQAKTIEQIERTTRKLKREHGIKWIGVDYAQRIKTERRGLDKKETVGLVSGCLKDLSQEHDLAVVVLAQATRDAGSTIRDRRPVARRMTDQDIAWNSQLEQDADLLMFIGDRLQPPRLVEEIYSYPEFWIAKQRNGKRFIPIPMMFEGACCRFQEDTRSPEQMGLDGMDA